MWSSHKWLVCMGMSFCPCDLCRRRYDFDLGNLMAASVSSVFLCYIGQFGCVKHPSGVSVHLWACHFAPVTSVNLQALELWPWVWKSWKKCDSWCSLIHSQRDWVGKGISFQTDQVCCIIEYSVRGARSRKKHKIHAGLWLIFPNLIHVKSSILTHCCFGRSMTHSH